MLQMPHPPWTLQKNCLNKGRTLTVEIALIIMVKERTPTGGFENRRRELYNVQVKKEITRKIRN